MSPPASPKTAGRSSAAGARHRARRARLGRRRHDLGRRVPARRLSRLPTAWQLQAGRDAGRRAAPSASRGATSMRTSWPQIGWAELTRSFGPLEFCADLPASRARLLDAMIARALNAPLGIVLRPAVRRGRRRARHLPRAPGLRRRGGDAARGDRRRAALRDDATPRIRSRSPATPVCSRSSRGRCGRRC